MRHTIERHFQGYGGNDTAPARTGPKKPVMSGFFRPYSVTKTAVSAYALRPVALRHSLIAQANMFSFLFKAPTIILTGENILIQRIDLCTKPYYNIKMYDYVHDNKRNKGKAIMNVEFKELNSIIGKINSIYHEAALKLGISDSERDILYVLCDKGSGCNQSALYKETGMTRSTVNSAIRKLESAGILYLTAGKGRNTCVVLTEKGEKYIAETVGKLVEIENNIYFGWTQEERQFFLRLNQKFADELDSGVQKL